MNKQKALETIDAALRALDGLQQALDLNDLRSVEIELQTAQQELTNLREMVEQEKDNTHEHTNH